MVGMDWMGRWRDRSGMEGRNLAGVIMVEPPLVPERERQHWLLKSDGRWEAVAGTNFIGAARARSIFVGAEK